MTKEEQEIIDKLELTNNKEWKLKTSIFFVDATTNEQFNLWKENKYERDVKYHYDWLEDSEGFSQCIGLIKDDSSMPVYVSFNFAKLDGQRICFYNTTSRFVDHDLVETFIKTNYPVKYDNKSRIAMTNASNFHHVRSAIEQRNKTNT